MVLRIVAFGVPVNSGVNAGEQALIVPPVVTVTCVAHVPLVPAGV